MRADKIEFYNDEIRDFELGLKHYKKKASSYSWLRTVAFLLVCITIYYYYSESEPVFGIAALCSFLAFVTLITIHRKYKYQVDIHEAKIELCTDELNRINLQLSEFDDGLRFSIANHHYMDDLDVFGKHSIFQLLNRCKIEDSKKLLAQWLSDPASTKEIIARQNAASALKNKFNWLLEFSSTLKLAVEQRKERDPNVSSNDIFIWANKSLDVNLHTKKAVGISLAVIFILSVAGIFYFELPYFFILPSAILNLIALGITHKQLEIASTGIDGSKSVFGSYEKAIEQLVLLDIDDKILNGFKERLIETQAQKSFNELNKIIHRISARSNMFYFLLNTGLLLDIHSLIALENWRRKYASNIQSWMDFIHETECLISLSAHSFNNPIFSAPTIEEEPFLFNAENLGHPLIPAEEKVLNNYSLNGSGSVDILTGSNMSGKSTFQRTLGVNIILAQMGASVNATKLELSLMTVFTSMRTKDNLVENTSSFYAELKRIRQLLDLVAQKKSVFFLLDEILKGTNSEDRHIGAIALANQLSQKSSFGIISTHDLQLSELALENKKIRNFSFNSEIIDNKISFDYKLTKGACKSFNASQLMRNMGILPS